MSQQPNQRILRERVEQAKALIKKGQYSKARYLLGESRAHPQAEKLLKQIEGRDDKLQGGLTNFFNVTVLAIVGLSIVTIFVVYTMVTRIQDNVGHRDSVVAQFSERGLEGNAILYADLVYYCYDQVGGEQRPSCLDWGELVYTEHETDVRRCVIVDERNGIQYRNRPMEEIATCFSERGIPDPS
ncbi:MAG: hypothetical protein ACFE0Q_00990 [Anaerolineae bacterium]